MALENDVKKYLSDNNFNFVDNTYATDLLDFHINTNNQIYSLEIKEKNKPYNCKNWDITIQDEQYMFILDDLTSRKMAYYSLQFGTLSGILIKMLNGDLYFANLITLCLITKKRYNRFNDGFKKGKQMIDVRELKKIKNIEDATRLLTRDYNFNDNGEAFSDTHISFTRSQMASIISFMVSRKEPYKATSKGNVYLVNLLQSPRIKTFYDKNDYNVRFSYNVFNENLINISALDCHPLYENENIFEGGVVRTQEHRTFDLENSKK